MANYACERCGACCRHWIVEGDAVDVLREPCIARECLRLGGHGSLELAESLSWSIACGKEQPCPFLADNRCTIYPTRPAECVAFSPGGKKCAEGRRSEGLAPLAESDSDGSVEAAVRDCVRVLNDDDEWD